MNELARDIAKNILKDDAIIEDRIARGIEENRKGSGEIELVDHEGKSISNANIKLRQIRHEFHFGCNSFMLGQFDEEEKNAAHDEAFKNLFNLAVVPFYWDALEPEDGKLRFNKDSPNIYRRPAPDLVLEFCEANNIITKGHPLCWDILNPKWMPLDKPSMASRLERRISEIADRYRDRIKIWDVCNEAIRLKPSSVEMRTPENHVELSFALANKYFPKTTTLNYNDYLCWDNHAEYTPMYMLCRHLAKLNCNLGGVGLQFHVVAREVANLLGEADVRLNPRHLLAMLDLYAKLGIPINISEITIPSYADLGDGHTFQKEVAERLYRLWFSHSAINGITWWNFIDDTAYVDPNNSKWNENYYKGGLLNYDLSPKSAYESLKRLIKEEWQTDDTIAYTAGTDNRFRGFYGDYEVTVETNDGIFKDKLKLSKGSINKFKLELK